jgi:hypothetical protein
MAKSLVVNLYCWGEMPIIRARDAHGHDRIQLKGATNGIMGIQRKKKLT